MSVVPSSEASIGPVTVSTVATPGVFQVSFTTAITIDAIRQITQTIIR